MRLISCDVDDENKLQGCLRNNHSSESEEVPVRWPRSMHWKHVSHAWVVCRGRGVGGRNDNPPMLEFADHSAPWVRAPRSANERLG